jgi:pilus assembly protein Flp/PilA
MTCAVRPREFPSPHVQIGDRDDIDGIDVWRARGGSACEGFVPGGGPNPKLAHGQGGSMKSLWQAFWSDESGQGLVEYALIIALVAVGLIAILLVLRNSIGDVFNNASEALQNAPANPYP